MEYNEEQLSIIESEEPFLQVIAAAGSGKTRTITGLVGKILRDGKEKESDILVITFTRKAAAEIRKRINQKFLVESLNIMTFHSYCFKSLRKYHPFYSVNEIKLIEKDEKDKLTRSILQKERFKIGGIPYNFFLNDNAGIISRLFPDIVNLIQKEYQEYKNTNHLLDFNDLQLIFLNDLKKKEPWTIEASNNIKRIIIDEFQDTDPIQLEWLRYMNPDKLMVVGDDWQAIYGFRGASTKPFLEFTKYFPCKKYFLSTNYRSLPEIIKISAIPIGKNKLNIKKQVKPYRKGKGKIHRIALEANKMEFYYSEIREIIKRNSCIKILCRSNFSIREYMMHGIPGENILTIHSAKGLEFKFVIIDLVSGWNTQITAPNEIIEEERRILYVALSRAEDQLLIVGNEKLAKKRIEDTFFSYFKFVPNLSIEKLSRIFN